MKTYKNLYPKIVSFENLLKAAGKAQRGKRFKDSTAYFNLNLEKEIIQLQAELESQTYIHGGYNDFFVYDPKRRLISAAPYRDRVVHHALCNTIEPLFDRTFIFDTYACRKGKGVHAGVNRYSQFAKTNTYVLKCDIKRYFQSIDHEILLHLLKSKIHCSKTLGLIKTILFSRADQREVEYFKEDDLFTPFKSNKGIPLGNLTSQFFANLYLNNFDHYVKECLRLPYIRYVDDFVLFSKAKNRLHEAKLRIDDQLGRLRLKLHERKCRVYQVKEGVEFLGYRIFPTHRLLKKGNTLRIRRRLRKFQQQYRDQEIPLKKIHQTIQSWIGHASHAKTYHLRKRLLEDIVLKRDTTRGASRRFVEQQP